VLHPRGSEYQTQFVIDGVPLTDNRSPASGHEIEADDAGSLTVYTAGTPAEYGRKMGGIVEVDTSKIHVPACTAKLSSLQAVSEPQMPIYSRNMDGGKMPRPSVPTAP